MHKINSKYNMTVDMAIDIKDKKIKDSINKYYEKDNVKVTWISLEKDNSFNKNEGLYLTLEFDDITDDDAKQKVKNVFLDELKSFLKKVGYKKKMKTCIVGLGNAKSTPDCLGPLVIDNIITTKHFYDMKIDVDKKMSETSCITPGVTSKTGIETSDYIKSIVDLIKPDLVIVVDALSSTTISRLNKSIQITDSGISPGSGVSNKRKEISKNTLNVPVVSIGVPTVTKLSIIVKDALDLMIKNYCYNKQNINNKSNKFIVDSVNFLNKDFKINKEDEKELLGLLGALSSDERLMYINEVFSSVNYNLIVSSKEIDFLIEKLSEIISFGINKSLHDI